jgi:hypothetical protein
MTALSRILTVVLSLALLCSVAAAAQRAKGGSVTGKWEGIAKGAGEGDLPFTMELRSEAGKIVGQIISSQGNLTVSNGTFADGKLSITITNAEGATGTITGTLKENKLSGEWKLGEGGGTYEASKAATKKASN